MNETIVWSERARKDLIEIKSFYDKRNQSTKYSNKLLQSFRSAAALIEKYPLVAVRTDIENVRGFIVSNYILFYEILDKHILILTVWDSRRDPKQLEDLLKQ